MEPSRREASWPRSSVLRVDMLLMSIRSRRVARRMAWVFISSSTVTIANEAQRNPDGTFKEGSKLAKELGAQGGHAAHESG